MQCIICHGEFEQTRSNRVCCSHKCAQAKWFRDQGANYFADRYAANPEAAKAAVKRHTAKLKDIVYLATVIDPKFLTLDHVNNDGHEHRKVLKHRNPATLYRWIIENNFPPMFQVLCFNCNCGKNVNGGICPHFGDKL
jgi:hypothetical protein